jgi:hypothetical protein
LDLAGDDGCPGVRLYDGIGALATPPTSLPVAVTAAIPVNLVARHPGGALRWTRRIADNAGPIAFWPLDWTVRSLRFRVHVDA